MTYRRRQPSDCPLTLLHVHYLTTDYAGEGLSPWPSIRVSWPRKGHPASCLSTVALGDHLQEPNPQGAVQCLHLLRVFLLPIDDRAEQDCPATGLSGVVGALDIPGHQSICCSDERLFKQSHLLKINNANSQAAPGSLRCF